jgi:hypothetical protein
MAIKIDFVSRLPVDGEDVRRFYAENWKRKIALSDKKFYEWQFVEAPNNEKKDYCVIAYDDQSGSILGVMGLNKRNFILNKEIFRGAELTTWIVSDKAAGSGIGASIIEFIKDNFEILIGMGISDAALPIYMRAGFRYLRNIPRFVKVLNFEPLKAHSVYSKLAVSLIDNWKLKPKNNFVAKESVLDDSDDAFLLAKEGLNLFSRDKAHRNWRYDSHPYFEYRQYSVENPDKGSSAKCFLAFREEKAVSEFKILHVMDLFGCDDAVPSALSFIESYARDHDFDVIDFYCTASRIYRFMLAGGWFSINDDPCFQFPHLFHPIEMRSPPTTSLIYWAGNNISEMADLSRLYVTKQDADLDRPTMHAIEVM